MKLALIAPSIIPARTANSIQTMKMAQAFAQMGIAIRLLVPGRNETFNWEKLAHQYGLEESFGLEWIQLDRRWRGYDFAFKAVANAKRWQADLVFTRQPQAAALAARRGLATIYEAHDMPQGTFGPRLFQALLKSPHTKRVVSISSALAADLQSQFKFPQRDDFLIIAPDGVDLDRYQDLRTPSEARKNLNLPDRFTAGYTGHLYTGRGAELIVEIAAQLPEISFLLVGGEPKDVQRVQNEVDQAGLANVTLTGFIPNSELPTYQAACDVLLMPYQRQVSASSGGDIARYLSPMKMFEYLATGRPVLASDLPVLQEVLNEQNAVILPAADAHAWAAALTDLKTNQSRRATLGKYGRQTAEQHTWLARTRQVLSGLVTD